MARGELRALVATASLDLGVDWGNVDLVVQMGAPKGSSRLLQRIGRANHRLDQVSPMAVPIMAMIGRETVPHGAVDDFLLLEAESLADAAMSARLPA